MKDKLILLAARVLWWLLTGRMVAGHRMTTPLNCAWRGE